MTVSERVEVDEELAEIGAETSTVEESVHFVAQISSGGSCVEGEYLFAGVEFSASKLPFPVVLEEGVPILVEK
jgi:hypothetical protein